MIRDLFVPREIKRQFARRPMSPGAFIKNFAKMTGVGKVNLNVAREFRKIYRNSYLSETRPIFIFGDCGSGKSFMCEMIALYDAMHYACLKERKRQFNIVVLSSTHQNFLAENLRNLLRKFSNDVNVIVVTDSTNQMLVGRRNVDCIIEDDNGCGVNVVTESLAQSAYGHCYPLYSSHVIITNHLRVPEMVLPESRARFVVNLF